MDNPTFLQGEAIEFASRAIHFDNVGQLEPAIFYYKEAVQALLSVQAILTSESQNPELLEQIEGKIKDYSERAKLLTETQTKTKAFTTLTPNQQQSDLGRAEFLLHQAFDEDEDDNKDEAVELYMQAAELCLNARNKTSDIALQRKLSKLAEQALERAESLKGITSPVVEQPNNTLPVSPIQQRPISPQPTRAAHHRVIPPLGIGNINLDKQSNTEVRKMPSSSGTNEKLNLQVSGSQTYTKEEIEVLRLTSSINNREFVPFLLVDLRERFAYPIPFSDRDGKLVLSPKQKKSFCKWVRPEELCPNPKMVEVIDCFSIKQTIVSDCSFVASLAISAQYEKRFKKRLITSIIYPQTRKGDPIYNPCGKYMIKLNLNGVPRKVIIDDFLPVGSMGELLCSYSTNKNELWISLLEKAYMKVMGGYDFPGSNSNIDLHALTGWIPERVAIRPDDKDFNKDQVFRKILSKFHRGDVLVTIATGDLTEIEAERAGLVSTHAYAMLDIREIKGKRLFLLKNPWSHLRWKGNFSERDTQHWTPDLKEELNFDPKSAQMFDNGVFWIDYESICRFFDVIYMNWNPSLFKYTFCIHQTWKTDSGPIKDIYNIGENPQYCLEVEAGAPSAIWILLTRHITDKEDFANNREYITVLVYKNDGNKVYYPYDPPPYIDGTRINSPHYLCKMLINDTGRKRFTLVISQYEKMNTIHYTLRAYSTSPFLLTKIKNPYKFPQTVTGEWKGITAGGCGNHPATYKNNPVYQITLNSASDDNELLIDLKGPKQYQIGFDLVTVTVNNSSSAHQFSRKSSGPFRGLAIHNRE